MAVVTLFSFPHIMYYQYRGGNAYEGRCVKQPESFERYSETDFRNKRRMTEKNPVRALPAMTGLFYLYTLTGVSIYNGFVHADICV